MVTIRLTSPDGNTTTVSYESYVTNTQIERVTTEMSAVYPEHGITVDYS